MVASLEMLSGRSKKEYAREAEAVASEPSGASAPASIAANGANGAADEALEAVVTM